MTTVKGVDNQEVSTLGHGDIEAAVWRTEAIEAAAKAVVSAAVATVLMDGAGAAIPIPRTLLAALAKALKVEV